MVANGPLVIDIFTEFEKYRYWPNESIPLSNQLTLVLLNPDIPCIGKQCRSRSGSALFAIKYVNLYQQPGSSNLIG